MFAKGTADRSKIQEANKHLQLLYLQISDLETSLHEQGAKYDGKVADLTTQLQSCAAAKDAVIEDLHNKLTESNATVSSLQLKLRENERLISHLQCKCDLFDYLAKQKPAIEEVLSVMNSSQRMDQLYLGSASTCVVVTKTTDTGPADHPVEDRRGHLDATSCESQTKDHFKKVLLKPGSEDNFSISSDVDDGDKQEEPDFPKPDNLNTNENNILNSKHKELYL